MWISLKIFCCCHSSNAHETLFVQTQIQVKTGPTPALSPLQRMASDNTSNLDCSAAKEKVPLALSEPPTMVDAPLRSPLALTQGK